MTTKAKTATVPENGETVFIPLNKLKKHPKNARKTPHSEASIEAKAASIAVKGILQNLVVEPERDSEGEPTGCYLVSIGEAPELARDADHVVIDGPPRVAGLMRSALLAADLVLIPVQPSPFDGWASAEMLALLSEARIYRPELVARFVLNRCAARTVIARETAETLADHDPPVLAATIGQRVVFADAAQSGRLVSEIDGDSPAAREITALAAEIERLRVGRAAP